MRGVDVVPTTVTPAVIPATFRAGVGRVDLTLFWKEYDASCRQSGEHAETERAGDSMEADINALFDNNLLWAGAADVEGIGEDALLPTRSFFSHGSRGAHVRDEVCEYSAVPRRRVAIKPQIVRGYDMTVRWTERQSGEAEIEGSADGRRVRTNWGEAVTIVCQGV